MNQDRNKAHNFNTETSSNGSALTVN